MKGDRIIENSISRIKLNEERFDEVSIVINDLVNSIEKYKNIYKKIIEINKYYGSKNWFNDKENFEKGIIKNVKAGILSEDAIWNLLERIKELNKEMNEITTKIFKG